MLDHSVLTSKLDQYGIRCQILSCFKSYLSRPSLVAKITNNLNGVTYSKKHEITYRTAQGSCLGPLHFVIFCNDIYMLPLMSKVVLFADDTTLLENHKNKRFLEYTIEHDMSLLMDWFRANKLSLNISKTVVMRFWQT